MGIKVGDLVKAIEDVNSEIFKDKVYPVLEINERFGRATFIYVSEQEGFKRKGWYSYRFKKFREMTTLEKIVYGINDGD